MNEAQWVKWGLDAVMFVIDLVTRGGARDAFLVALDARLATFRADVDAKLRAKHRDDEPTKETPVPGKTR